MKPASSRRAVIGVTAALAAVLLTPATAHAITWLDRVNQIRGLSLLGTVTESATLTKGDQDHAIYQGMNNVCTHAENSRNGWYTSIGNAAGTNGNVALGYGPLTSINAWAAGPFHLIGMTNPQLKSTGFGWVTSGTKYTNSAGRTGTAANYAAAMDTIRGVNSSIRVDRLIAIPGPGSTTNVLSYGGGEFPNPITATGYSLPTGAPITLRFTGAVPTVKAVTTYCDGVNLVNGIRTESNYTNSNVNDQKVGRAILHNNHTIYVMPKKPLVAGKTYTVTVNTSIGVWRWSFKTSSTTCLPATSASPTRL